MLYGLGAQAHALVVGEKRMQQLVFPGFFVQFPGMLSTSIPFFLGRGFRYGGGLTVFPGNPVVQVTQEVGGLAGPRELEGNFVVRFVHRTARAMLARHSLYN